MNRSGFVSVSLVFFLPVIISFLTLTFWTHRFLILSEKQNDICLKNLISLQRKHTRSLKRLLSLNSKAQKLILSKKQAKIRLAQAIASKNPVAIASATVHLQSILRNQQFLSFVQQSILTKAETFRSLSIHEVQNQLNRSNAEKVIYEIPPLPATSLKNDTVAPTYKIKAPLEKSSLMRVIWDTRLAPPLMPTSFISQKSNYKNQCGILLSNTQFNRRKGKTWTLEIDAAKYL